MRSSPLAQFRVHDTDLQSDTQINDAYERYRSARVELGRAYREAIAASARLGNILRKPLLSQGLIQDGQHFTLTLDKDRTGLAISVYPEPRLRGRRRKVLASVPEANRKTPRPLSNREKFDAIIAQLNRKA